MTMSSAFSGIGAPEQSVHGIRSYLSHAVPGTPTMVRQIAACDWNSFSRAELAHSASPPEHMFSNIVEFISPSVRDYVVDKANCAQWTAKSLWVYLSQSGVMTLRAFCSCCRAPCKYMRARIHVAGTPCIDHSTQPGAKRRGILGASCVPLFSWMRSRHLLQEDICIHENVSDFEPGFLATFLGSCYIIMSVLVDMHAHGFPIRRRRRITLMVHRSLVTHRVSPMIRWSKEWVSHLKRRCAISFHVFLLAPDSEITEFQSWAASRVSRGGDPSVGTLDRFKTNADVQPYPAVQAINQSELTRLRKYRRRWPSLTFSRAYALWQEPHGAPCVSQPRVFQCQTRKQGIVFLDLLNRYVMPSEFLTLQGFPVPACTKLFNETTSFDMPLAARDPRQTIEQSGNSMPVPVIGMSIIYACLVALLPSHGSANSVKVDPSVAHPISTASASSYRSELRATMRGRKRPRSVG